jgi:hypothetical protein
MPRSILFDIQNIDLSAYEKIIGEYVDCFSRSKRVLWIGQFGSTAAPGISDIDLILVCEDEYCRPLSIDTREFVERSALRRYLFFHPVSVVPRSAVKYLFYFHPLDGLRSLWGNTALLEECEPPDEVICLFRAVLWNSDCWTRALWQCQQDNVSLRKILLYSRGLVIGAVNNFHLMGNGISAEAANQRVEQERQKILSANPGDKCDLAKASFWGSVQTLAKSDWELSAWLIQKGLSDERGKRKKIRISQNHMIVLDDSYESSQENFHQHVHKIHVTYLPFFYFAIGCLVAQPYLVAEPRLSKLWDKQVTVEIENVNLMRAAAKWIKAFKDYRNIGLIPLGLYPFGVREVDSEMRRLLRQVLPSRVKWWLREWLQPQKPH